MGGDLNALLAALPPWAQVAANAALFLLTLAAGAWGIRKGHKDEDEKQREVFDPKDLLESSPIRRMVEAWERIADATELQAKIAREEAEARRMRDEFARQFGGDHGRRGPR